MGYMNCLTPGDDPRHIESKPKDQGPPEGFIDNTVKCGRLLPDGSIEYYGTMPAFPEGQDLTKADITFTGDKKREVNDEVSNLNATTYNWDELYPQVEKMLADGTKPADIAKALNMPNTTLLSKISRVNSQAEKKSPKKPTVNKDFDKLFDPPEHTGFTPEDDKPIEYTVNEIVEIQERIQKMDRNIDEAFNNMNVDFHNKLAELEQRLSSSIRKHQCEVQYDKKRLDAVIKWGETEVDPKTQGIDQLKQDLGQRLSEINGRFGDFDMRIKSLNRTMTGHITGEVTKQSDTAPLARLIAQVLKELIA